jgi:hypothetical protein
LTLKDVIKSPGSAGNSETQGGLRLVKWNLLVPAGARITKLATRLCRLRLNVFAAAGAGVNESFTHQSLKVGLVHLFPFGLTPEVGWNLDAKPLEVSDN